MKRIYFSNRPNDEFTLLGETERIVKFNILNGGWVGVYDKVTKHGYPEDYPSHTVHYGDYSIEE